MSALNEDFAYYDNTTLSWYTMRLYVLQEEKIIEFLWEKINFFNLKDKITDIVCFNEEKIIESEEIPPNSSKIPQGGFKNTENTKWAKISNGNYKRIRLITKKPFKGIIFIKMIYSPELFAKIKSWEKGIYFLGDPEPKAISDNEFNKMKNSIPNTKLNLKKYCDENYYVIVEGKSLTANNIQPLSAPEKEVCIEEVKQLKTPNEKISSLKNIKSNFSIPEKKVSKQQTIEKNLPESNSESSFKMSNLKPINFKKIKVSDFVVVNSMGIKAEIQNIDYEKQEVIVSIQVFGRKQPITCKFDQISEI